MGYCRIGDVIAMLARQKPIDEGRFYMVKDGDLNRDLQIGGFAPMYYYDKTFYYIRSDELLKFIEERR